MGVLPACIYVLHICAWCQKGQKKVSNALGLELQTAMSHLWVWESHLGPPQEQPLFLTDEPTRQPLEQIFIHSCL